MTTPNYLIDAIIGKATIALKNNQDETGGLIDYQRFQEEMAIFLMPVEDLQKSNVQLNYECDELVKALKEEIAARNDAEEQTKAVQAICLDLQRGNGILYPSFVDDQLN